MCNPRTKRFVLIDKDAGIIVKHKRTKGPYKGVRVVDSASRQMPETNGVPSTR